MKILHITNWYPSPTEPYRALWIKRHIEALQPYAANLIYHIEVEKGALSFSFDTDGNVTTYRIQLPFRIWLITEWLTYLLVWHVLQKEKNNFDIANFHIAYPLCVKLEQLKKLILKPVVITEHWSAYHFHFGIKYSPKLNKIKSIFTCADKIITVSEALKEDIAHFTEKDQLPIVVVPNIVDTSIFYFQERPQPTCRFFMVSQWKEPKDPFKVIDAFAKFSDQVPDATLRIGGYGSQETKMIEQIRALRMESKILYLGKMNSEEIAEEMRCATAFIHPSLYETFSVVCAESICCGCPVIAPQIGGIPEFINLTNGFLYNDNTDIINLFEKSATHFFDRQKIAQEASRQFSAQSIGKLYFETLRDT